MKKKSIQAIAIAALFIGMGYSQNTWALQDATGTGEPEMAANQFRGQALETESSQIVYKQVERTNVKIQKSPYINPDIFGYFNMENEEVEV